jgi:hypothetical protein
VQNLFAQSTTGKFTGQLNTLESNENAKQLFLLIFGIFFHAK